MRGQAEKAALGPRLRKNTDFLRLLSGHLLDGGLELLKRGHGVIAKKRG